MSIYEDLKNLEQKITESGYEIDRFEIRERVESYKPSQLDGRPAQRAVGENILQTLEDWNSIDEENYVIEIFLSGRNNNLDRIIYDSEREEAEYIGFSKKESSIKELLEE